MLVGQGQKGMKKILEYLFVTFFVLFMVSGAKFLIDYSQQDPHAAEMDRETKAIQDNIDALQLLKNQEAQKTIKCEKLASELARIGQLSIISKNADCANWQPSSKVYAINSAAISSINATVIAPIAKTTTDSNDLVRSIETIEALYIDKETDLQAAYNQVKRQRNQQYMSEQLSEGQYNYYKHIEHIQYLEKVVKNRQQMISAINTEINKRVDVKALYAKYNIPTDAGAATLAVIVKQIPSSTEKAALSGLVKIKTK
jgi:hypothetical protein